ncbi:E3 ubiquitin-protein ligase TRIM38-like [Octodon degus]|uniref:E3 ubiquitin-protein ligase TRIM38-like n=1 Tax=Octodon degus TaxID=10160 RepID=A0A6P3FLQ9_OCTDE|nr:E3 ubiquitin-protein ligase TRIM38-like [Octodon degus]
MASAASLKEIQEIATCFLCSNLLDIPVSLDCGHSYCNLCLQTFCRKEALLKKVVCPQCLLPNNVNSWRHNKHLERIITVLRKMAETQSESECEEHGEPLRLFCEDDKQLICQRCEQAPEHQGHTTVPVEDACQGYKEKLQKAVARLRDLHTECMNQKTLIRTQIAKWQKEIAVQKQKVKVDFEKLHTFLHEEEKLWIWRLENEEEQMLRTLRENEADLQQKSEEIMNHIQELEAKCQSSAQKLLQDVEETLSRACTVKLEAPKAFSMKVQTVCDVAELYLDVKVMLRRHQASVTLDPDTAHPALTVSKDWRQVSYGCIQQNLKASSRRFTMLPCVLGCEGFSSGRHYFEVDVGEGTAWDVGVCMENVQRGFGMIQDPDSGFWAIRLCTEDSYVALTLPHTVLKLPERPLVVGVVLDCEAGAVSFYNMTSGSHIFTFPKASFSGTLWPFFRVYPYSPLFLPSCTE